MSEFCAGNREFLVFVLGRALKREYDLFDLSEEEIFDSTITLYDNFYGGNYDPGDKSICLEQQVGLEEYIEKRARPELRWTAYRDYIDDWVNMNDYPTGSHIPDSYNEWVTATFPEM